MNTESQLIQQEIDKKKKVEKLLRLRSIGIVLLFFITTGIWSYYTSNQVLKLNKEKNDLTNQIYNLKIKVDSIQSRFDSVNLISNYIATNLDAFLIVKHLFGTNEGIANTIRDMLELKDQKAKFNFNPNSDSRIFNSPSFIGYVLGKNNLTQKGIETTEGLKQHSHIVSTPEIGDLVFYPNGYVMMYLGMPESSPYEICIGMTPWGVQVLYTNFAIPIEYRRIET